METKAPMQLKQMLEHGLRAPKNGARSCMPTLLTQTGHPVPALNLALPLEPRRERRQSILHEFRNEDVPAATSLSPPIRGITLSLGKVN